MYSLARLVRVPVDNLRVGVSISMLTPFFCSYNCDEKLRVECAIAVCFSLSASMESGLPMLNCLLQHTLKSLCSYSDCSASSKWAYAVFWRILPRNYPPPKWDYGGSALDRNKGNKRNWILVWEDGFCDFYECEQAGSGCMKGRFGADVFFKMSHEVYNYGEGLVGKVAADNTHKWVFRDPSNEGDSSFISSWNVSLEPQPRAWEYQFKTGIQTIAIISVREGIIQLGSFDKIMEDLNLVISIQRKFSFLQSIPGVFALQRPSLPIQHPYSIKPSTPMLESQQTALSIYEKRHSTGAKRLFDETTNESPIKSINLGWNTPQNSTSGSHLWPIPPLLPSMSCSLGALLSKLPSVTSSYNAVEASENTTMLVNNNNSANQRLKVNNGNIKLESSSLLDTTREKTSSIRFEPSREVENQSRTALNLN